MTKDNKNKCLKYYSESYLSRFLRAAITVLVGCLALGQARVPASPAHAETAAERIVVQGEGEVEIRDQDLSGARKKALNMAMRAAFESALMQASPDPLSLAEQQELLRELAPRLNDFLVQYRFEEMPSEEVIFVTVEAAFSRSSFLAEFQRRGLLSQEGAEPQPLVLLIRGVQELRAYREILRELGRTSGAASLVPLEIYGNDLSLKVLYRGTMEEPEASARKTLDDLVSRGAVPVGGLEVSVSRVPPAAAREGAAAGGDDPSAAGIVRPAPVP